MNKGENGHRQDSLKSWRVQAILAAELTAFLDDLEEADPPR
jgi:hypothetical protein